MGGPIHGRRWAHARYCDAAEAEIAAFAAAVREADPAAPVPTCPGWSVADLVLHLGRTHRWAHALVDRLSPGNLRHRDIDMDFPADRRDPAGYLPWFDAGAAALLGALRRADPQAVMWSWGADRRVRYWSRRMLHETAVHRCDAEFAAGRDPVLDEEVAEDAVDELLDNLPYAASWAPHVERLRGAGETIALVSSGTGTRWLIRLEPGGFSWSRTAEEETKATASVRGTASDVDLFLWGRRKLGDPRLEFAGEDALLIHWVENSAI
ncbi:TIGR03083 family protein [Thermomonospora echinospora]|uniref:TIGR03083 family protein n=1 Tax=Thermomonospora echinospora TaxID=1992 RepID=A0A1H5S626_9ACTN|nr:maleylpyruvate isomerase family mycothiol-dependent enzyme [Thermomonospora echinospora]SEF45231.1 TIGR03083 family protein [Thermomonospora echinospora]